MTFKPYAKYKPSGVEWLGDVPEGWELKRYKQVFSEREERSIDGSETLLSVSAYTGVSPRANIISEGDHLSRAETLEGYKVCYPFDLVMNIMLAWNRGLGFSKHYGIVSPAYCVFKLIDKSEPKFLDYLVRSDQSIIYFKAFSSGVIDSRLRLYPDVFGRLVCALPQAALQANIADFLDRETAKINTLLAKQEAMISLLKEKRQAVISHAVTKGLDPSVRMKATGVEWIGDVPEHWALPKISYLAEVRNGSTPDRSKPEFWGGTIPWLASGKVNDFIVESADEYITESGLEASPLSLFPSGTVLVGLVGQGRTRAMSALLTFPSYINQNMAGIVVGPDINSTYLLHVLGAGYAALRDFGRGGQQDALNCGILGAFRIPLAPTNEQLLIVAYLEAALSKFDTLIAKAHQAIALQKEHRTALISAAVTGKIDVRGEGPHLLQEKEAA